VADQVLAGTLAPHIQRAATASAGVDVTPAVEAGVAGLRGGGQPLAPETRGLMEQRIGHDFGQVRVHTDARAADLAGQVRARAFTVGPDVAFAPGQYQPASPAGQRLLAHELTHVAQQGQAVIRRHPEGAAAPDEEDLETLQELPSPADSAGPPAADDAAPTSDSATSSSTTTTSDSDSAAPAADTDPAAALPAAEGTSGTSGTSKAMSKVKANELLTASYGSVKTIVPGNVVVLKDANELWAKYDEVCIAAKLTNPDTGKLWVAGDSKKRSPGLEGFAWEGTSYISGTATLITATAHEMLHNNTAAGFRAAVGEGVNEGSTEYMAIKALKAGSVAMASTAYPDEVAMVTKLIGVVTEATLIAAYFGGASTLITAYETKKGAGTWATMKAKADLKDWSGAKALMDAPKKADATK
jgi:hypothetical protein